MPSSASTRLRIELQNTGENFNSWGSKLNSTALALLEEAIAGVVSVAVAGNVVLTSTNYASDEARNAVLVFTGAGGFTVTTPSVEKVYLVHNQCADVVSVGPSGGTLAAILPGEIVMMYTDGVDAYRATVISSGGREWTSKSSAYTAKDGDRLLCDTSGGAFTITLPVPALGKEIIVKDEANSWHTNSLTLARNDPGESIAGSATDLTCDLRGAEVRLVGISATEWAA